MTTSGVWKTFERNEVTHSVAHHLAAIGELLEKNGYARVTDVARHLEITRGSASLTLKALRERDLVREDENKFLRLSEEGQRVVATVMAKRAIVRKFLEEVLRVAPQQAEVDACKVEHLVSQETGGKLLHFVRFLLSDRKIARCFLESFRVEEDPCSDLDDCPVCDRECLMAIGEDSE